ncbi:MAG: GNAT family N-acetyltransferase [Tissierellia bacterium]|nr:GNAT family N-acetyltransferase [Tissierellia bacterium]
MIEIRYEAENKRSAAYDGDKLVGYETYYVDENGYWVIDHTKVDENYGGQGIASKLVYENVKAARENNKKIIPVCKFAQREFEKKPEYKDVLAE